MTTKHATIRIGKDLLNQIDLKCDSLKCNRNDYIKNAIGFVLKYSSNLDFVDKLDTKRDPIKQQKTESKKQKGPSFGFLFVINSK